MRVPAEVVRSVQARWPHRADRWVTAVGPELDELCRRFAAIPEHVIPARFAFVVAASTSEHRLIMRATTDPAADAQTAVACELAQLSVGPYIHAATATDTGRWIVMDRVTPGTPLADAGLHTVDLDALTAPLRAMIEAPVPADDMPSIADWLRARLLDDHLSDIPPGVPPASGTEREHALNLLNDLTVDVRVGLCHGDASPWNILTDSSGRWLLIDPRGVRGEVEYDAAVMALKIFAAAPSVFDAVRMISDAAGLDPERVQAWKTIAHAARV